MGRTESAASDPMRLIVGIGNPGPKYDRTRHNVGFETIDRLARRCAPGEIARSRFHGSLIQAGAGEDRILILKPLTYVNKTGTAVAEAVQFYKLEPAEDLLVIVDDTALPCGRIRVRADGGAGGHNGLADITTRLGHDQWSRIRIGIDAPGDIPLASYVLGTFRPDQEANIEQGIESAVEAAQCWITHGVTTTMNTYNADQVRTGSAEESN